MGREKTLERKPTVFFWAGIHKEVHDFILHGLNVFVRVRMPREILMDQESNILSKLIPKLYTLLKIKALKNSGAHPQTDGSVKWFNGTVKAILRKFIGTDPCHWL